MSYNEFLMSDDPFIKTLQCDYVRAGIAMYGVLSNANDETTI